MEDLFLCFIMILVFVSGYFAAERFGRFLDEIRGSRNRFPAEQRKEARQGSERKPYAA